MSKAPLVLPAWVRICLLLTAAATIRVLLDPLLEDRAPYLVFTFAVLVVGMLYGLLPGLFTAAASTIAGVWLFIPPRFSFDAQSTDERADVAAFIVTSAAILLFSDRYRQARQMVASSLLESVATSNRLQESQGRLAAIVGSAMDAIIALDAKHKIVLFNPAAEQMFGYSASDICGASISKLFPEACSTAGVTDLGEILQADATSRRINSVGLAHGLRLSGEVFPLEASISDIIVEDQQLTTVILRDVTERQLHENAQASLVREVDHRAKNVLAVAQALVSLSRADTITDYIDTVGGRIASLARAHSLLSQSRWTGVRLQDLIAGELDPYLVRGWSMPSAASVKLANTAVQPFCLIFHEFATNAVKHGAATFDCGQVEVSWNVVESALELRWRETAERSLGVPGDPGVGLTLIRRTVEMQLCGTLDLGWTSSGLTALISVPANRIEPTL